MTLSHETQARVMFLNAQLEVGVRFVILEGHVIAWLVKFDQLFFKQKGFCFGIR